MKRPAYILAAAAFAAACSSETAPSNHGETDIVTEIAPSDLPGPVQSAVSATMPDMTVLEVLRKERDDRVYFDVEGERADGSEIELDILFLDGVAEVVEIQRDLMWANVPEAIQSAVYDAGATEPARIIESVQTDGSVIYELFAEGMPTDPAMEVKSEEGRVEILTERWPH